jgi:hypothetical protein
VISAVQSVKLAETTLQPAHRVFSHLPTSISLDSTAMINVPLEPNQMSRSLLALDVWRDAHFVIAKIKQNVSSALPLCLNFKAVV